MDWRLSELVQMKNLPDLGYQILHLDALEF
jgi:hypothetical protein